MSDRRSFPDEPTPGVTVVDRDVPADTWQAIGLDLTAKPLFDRRPAAEATRRWGASLATTRSWATLSASDALPETLPAEEAPKPATPPVSETPPEPRRVPARDIIVIGRPPAKRAGFFKRGTLRELFFLGLLGMTLYGAYYSGRMNGYQRVIVIPIPESRQSMIS